MENTHALLMTVAMIALSGAAAYSDWRSRRIPNALIVTGLFLALAVALSVRGADGLADSGAGFGIGLLLLLPGFLLGFTGAGDVKLLAMLGAWAGPTIIFQVFVVTVFFGAGTVIFIGLVSLVRSRATGKPPCTSRFGVMVKNSWTTGRFVCLPPPASSLMSLRLPMAPFMFSAALLILLSPLFGR